MTRSICRRKHRPGVACVAAEAYWTRMSVARLTKLLILFAVLLMPLGMINGGPAMASGVSTAPAGHCEQMPEHRQEQPDRLADCAVTCAAIPSRRDDLQGRILVLAQPRVAALTEILHGLGPEAAIPPPRFS